MDNNNFKFADCVDCLNKNDELTCSNCNCGELFSENFNQINFQEDSAEMQNYDCVDNWETSIEGFSINDDGEFEESFEEY